MSRLSALKMVKRRARKAGLPVEICAHSFRGTGITEYLRNGGELEVAARIAGHESTRTTHLYNRLERGDLARRDRTHPHLNVAGPVEMPSVGLSGHGGWCSAGDAVMVLHAIRATTLAIAVWLVIAPLGAGGLRRRAAGVGRRERRRGTEPVAGGGECGRPPGDAGAWTAVPPRALACSRNYVQAHRWFNLAASPRRAGRAEGAGRAGGKDDAGGAGRKRRSLLERGGRAAATPMACRTPPSRRPRPPFRIPPWFQTGVRRHRPFVEAQTLLRRTGLPARPGRWYLGSTHRRGIPGVSARRRAAGREDTDTGRATGHARARETPRWRGPGYRSARDDRWRRCAGPFDGEHPPPDGAPAGRSASSGHRQATSLD